MSVSDAKIRANTKWNKKAYDFFNLHFPKGKKEIIKEYADKTGNSINNYINIAIDRQLEKDGYIKEENEN